MSLAMIAALSWAFAMLTTSPSPLPIAAGNQMMVCENLCFSSDVKLARRHTTHILGDLPRVLASAVARVTSHWQDMGKRIDAYQQTEVVMLPL
jgi:hypothetical protein